MYIVCWREGPSTWNFVKCSDTHTAIKAVERATRNGYSEIKVWQAEKVELEVTVKLV